jgi:NAD(P)H-quinone oxidoreductase subunit 5
MQTLTPWLVIAGPLVLALAGLALPGRPATASRLAGAAAAFALACALLAAAALAIGGTVSHAFAGPAGIYFDALSATMLLLVSFVGAIVVRYTHRYLDGDAGQVRFLRWLCLTLAAVLTLMVAGNLALLAAAWIATSLALHRLLVFYPDRPAAQLAARKKFVASRVGDACVIAASVLIYQAFGTVELAALLAADGPPQAAESAGALPWIAGLLVTAALLKSAQFPFHGWLPEVMETPTPVSALLHAGIVNAGGFLVVRMSPLIAEAPGALDALVVAGAVTALFGATVMLTQTSIKVALAYSTIAQMGFMLLQCGLGAFSAAVLHIVAHSLYKAHAFLTSGSVVDIARAAWTTRGAGRAHPALVALVLAVALGVALGVGVLAGAMPLEKPGVVALGAILAMGVAHLLLQALAPQPATAVTLRAAGLAATVCIAYFALQVGAETLLLGAVAPTVAAQGAADLLLPALVVTAFAAAFLLQALLPHRAHRPAWRAAYVHLANGLYVNTFANRAVQRVWPLDPRSRAHTHTRSAA